MQAIAPQILEFATRTETQAATVENEVIKVRIKILNYNLNGTHQKVVVISDINIAEEYRGKKIFQHMMRAIAAVTPHKAIVVECVGNQGFAASLARDGWHSIPGDDISFFKATKFI